MKFNILLILTFFTNTITMDNVRLEHLLDKNYISVKELVSCDFRIRKHGEGFYINSEFVNEIFYTMPFNFITIVADESKNVQSITVHFQGMIDRVFYDAFNGTYGEPNHIQIIENRQLEGETFIRDENGKVIQHLKKNTFDLREGTFEEEPLWIVWEKEGYEIKAFLRHKNDMSQITFKKL